jgi:hypothetical protein
MSLRAQIVATKDALLGLVRAHIDLARAEAGEIGGEVARAAGLGALALACLFMLVFLLTIGLLLFIGTTVFGSMGWGILHGTLLLIAVAVWAVLAALRAPRLGLALGLAFLIGLVAAVFLGPALGGTLWTRIGEELALAIDPSVRALAVALIAWVILLSVLGAVIGWRRSRTPRGAIGGLFVGFILGVAIGAFSAITFTWQVAIAIGIAVWLAAWPILMGVFLAREGIDAEALKRRFTPQTTIDTTKETIEWAKARMPLGPRS